jgi:hypothetical protein
VVDRGEVEVIATGLRRDSTFDGRRTDLLDLGFEPFLEPFDDAAFVAFAFKRKGLDVEDARLAAFLVAFVLTFAFDAIRAATYTNYSS